MRPDFWFGVAIALSGLAVMAYGAWPTKETPQFKTLAIWTGEKGVGAVSWHEGALTKQDIESGGGYVNLKLDHVFTIEGRPVDAQWAKSITPK